MSTATDSPPARVAILGGGIASLITAFELTATPELRRRHEVTVYQMGWRLGGKLASSTNTSKHHRNEEHGLHVWFGFYDNAFARLQNCYRELLALQPAHRYPTVCDAFKANDRTPVGYREGDGYGFWDFNWPANDGTPGQCRELPAPAELIRGLVDFFWGLLRDLIGKDIDALGPVARPLMDRFQSRVAAVSPPGDGSLDHAMRHLGAWIASFDNKTAGDRDEEAEQLASYAEGLRDLVRDRLPTTLLVFGHPDRHPILSALEINLSIVRGCFSRRYGIYRDFNLNRIDDWDLRAWLIENGCRAKVANESSLLRALYDIPFAYENGDLGRPNFAAGAALRWTLRTFLTYQGHALYLPQCGFGEAVIGPYYQVLKTRGVKFRYFHKLTRIALAPDSDSVERLDFDVQAKTKGGADYDPVWFEDGLYRWPVEPLWDQLENGDALRQRAPDFESHWCPEPPAGQLSLRRGEDFDRVVLGIAATAMKRRNTVDTPFTEELIAASAPFRDWVQSLGAIATNGFQIWSPRTSAQLGWEKAPATVGGPEPLDVWADMTPVLETEHWDGVPGRPRSLHYLCGPLPTELFDQPATDTGVPFQASQLARQQALDWLHDNGIYDWPEAKDNAGHFDWDMLYDPENRPGPARIDAQFIRANIDPTGCCGASHAGTTRHRPDPGTPLLVNLHLVGADTRTGINVTCVEGATISALKAARDICGSPAQICHEDFMSGDFPELPT